jgi:hypothetical protein
MTLFCIADAGAAASGVTTAAIEKAAIIEMIVLSFLLDM